MPRSAPDARILRLLSIASRPQSELEELVGVARNTLRARLLALTTEGLIEFVPSGQPARRGQSKGLYRLAGHTETLPPTPIGTFRPGQLWVSASATGDGIDAMHDVLARQELTELASWGVELDGEPRQALIVFDASFGSQPADRLRRALRAAGVEAGTGTVRSVELADDMHARAFGLAREGL